MVADVLCLALAEAQWEDVYLETREDFLTLTLPYGQVPILQLSDGRIISQSGAIIRHIARSYGLYGSSSSEADAIDEIIEAHLDFFPNNGKLPWLSPEDRIKALADLPNICDRWLTRWEQVLSTRNFLVCETPSVADACVLRCAEDLVDFCGEDSLKRHPRLFAWRDRLKKIPSVSKYFASSRRFPAPIDPSIAEEYKKSVEIVLGRR